jgi:hypothetical protein
MVLLAYAPWTRLRIQRALGEKAAMVFTRRERLVVLTILIRTR